MAGTRVRVEGLRELEAALNRLPRATAKAVLRRVAIKALKPVDDAWRARAPHLTGNLDSSGGVGTKLTKRQARMNKRRGEKSSVEVFAGPNDPAAIPEEFGWVDGPAQPFLRPAWDATKYQALEIVKTELGGEIEKAAAKLAAKRARRAAI